MSGPQFSGEWIATEIVYYWITRFPCFVTLRYDSYRDIFIFDMHDERNWTTVGTALYETDLLSCLGDFPAPQGSVSAVLQKNVFDETFFRILNPFAYAGVNSPGHIILQINEDNVSVPLSFTGVRFLPLPDEYPDVEGDLWLEGSGTIDEDNVLHFAEAGLIPWSDWNGSLPAIDIRLKFDE